MKRTIIKIDEEKCNGCGLCVKACHEGAIEMVNGKARLMREDYCDGLGDCLPACPAEAISFEEREAPAYDHAAVLAAKAASSEPLPCGCPGTHSRRIERQTAAPCEARPHLTDDRCPPTELNQWPVQIKLVPVNAPYFEGANLLIAADCTAFAYGDFHRRFIRNHVTLIGCPKLDDGDYAEKLTQILRNNTIKSITVTRMVVPCCAGLENAVKRALAASGKEIPLQVAVISTDGMLLAGAD